MSGDDLVEVAFAPDPGEAEIIHEVLETRGIPSMVRSVGVEGPTVGYGLAVRSGRQVLVHASNEEAARQALAAAMGNAPPESTPGESELGNAENSGSGRGPRNYSLVGGYARALFWSLAAFALVAAVFFLARAL